MRSQFPSFSEAKDYIITAFLLVISSALLISYNQGGINGLRRISLTVYSYLELPLSKIRTHEQVAEENRRLRRQNIRLRNKLNRLQIVNSYSGDLTLSERGVADSLPLYPVQIVGKELHQANNVLTINAGSNDGLKVNMPVITERGLVGKIVLVAPNYSEVMPYLNTLFKVSAKLQTSQAYGIVSWNGEKINELQLKYVPKTIPVDSGELVLTSGYGHQFPPNIPIGTVKRTKMKEGRGFQLIFINPTVNLYTITNGFVWTGAPDSAQIKLQQQYRELFLNE